MEQSDAIEESESQSIQSVGKLAVCLGKCYSTTNQWIHHPQWQWNREPPWNRSDRDEILKWAEDTFKKPAKKISKETKLKQRVLEERARKLQLENDERSGKLHNTETCLQGKVKAVMHMKLALLDYVQTAEFLTDEQRNQLQVHTEKLLRLFSGKQ